MNSKICEKLGIEFPLFAFSHCRDVVVAVSKAGGMGVFGAVNLSPEALDVELRWIDEQLQGLPYGVDLIVPNSFESKGEQVSEAALLARVPQGHKDFVNALLDEYGVESEDLEAGRSQFLRFQQNMTPEGAKAALDVAFAHPIALIVNALGVPPQSMIDKGKEQGVSVGALVGARDHAAAQVAAGCDVLIVAGGEAGGHCGDVSTMVLVPEVVQTVGDNPDVAILAAGGIATGTQMAGAMAMGADGAWCGSVWLTTAEAETSPVVKEKMLAASSRDTVRSRSRTGKPSRQLRSPFVDAWEQEGSPQPLPMPLQSLVAEPALQKLDRLAGSHEGAAALSTYWVGQAVGLMNHARTSGQVVQDFKEDFVLAYERLQALMGD